jgi:hypothetical protein
MIGQNCRTSCIICSELGPGNGGGSGVGIGVGVGMGVGVGVGLGDCVGVDDGHAQLKESIEKQKKTMVDITNFILKIIVDICLVTCQM